MRAILCPAGTLLFSVSHQWFAGIMMTFVIVTYLRELGGGVFGADRREHHAAAALLPVGGGGQALRGGELEGVNRPNNLSK